MGPYAPDARLSDVTPGFRILGPLAVTGPAGSLRLVAPRQRTVLATLLLEADRVLSVERLAEAVWDQAPPPTARSQIQISVSKIRRALAEIGLADLVVTW